MSVGDFPPVRGSAGATAGVLTTAGVEVAFDGTSKKTAALSVGTYRLMAQANACHVRQGPQASVVALATDCLLSDGLVTGQVLIVRVTGAGDNGIAAIQDSAAGTLGVQRLDP